MSNGTPARIEPSTTTLEKVIVGGDLSGLNPSQRLEWYRTRCDAAGLDPRTQPFMYLNLKGKLQLYATKTATDQLIKIHRLTVEITDRQYNVELGIYEVRCRVTFPDCHHVEDVAAVDVFKIEGEDLCNQVMKCVTKAKRRTVLSACGLGMLDESEVDTIAEARVEPAPAPVERPTPLPTTEPRKLSPPSREYSEPVLPTSDIRRWIEDECVKRNDLWRNQCLIDGVEFKVVAHPSHVANHLIKAWIAEGALEEDAIKTDGKRDKNKLAAALQVAWREDSDEIKADVTEWLKGQLAERAKEAGVELADDGDTVTVASPAPAEAPADDGWQEGRE